MLNLNMRDPQRDRKPITPGTLLLHEMMFCHGNLQRKCREMRLIYDSFLTSVLFESHVRACFLRKPHLTSTDEGLRPKLLGYFQIYGTYSPLS